MNATNPDSIRQIALKNGMCKETLYKRLNRGKPLEQAILEPIRKRKHIDLNAVIEIEKQGLTISRSAYVLNVDDRSLARFISRKGISWRGKGVFKGTIK